MILLDTNVLTETMRPPGHPRVRAWLDGQAPSSLFICTPVLAEIRYGVEKLPAGAKRRALAKAAEDVELRFFAGRILPFEAEAAHIYGRIRALRRKQGRPVAPIDLMIAAIALTRGMRLATRNVGDFEGVGLDVVDPFTGAAA